MKISKLFLSVALLGTLVVGSLSADDYMDISKRTSAEQGRYCKDSNEIWSKADGKCIETKACTTHEECWGGTYHACHKGKCRHRCYTDHADTRACAKAGKKCITLPAAERKQDGALDGVCVSKE